MPSRQAGYTLIELIIVVFIIGLASSMILLRSSSIHFERKVTAFAQQLTSFIQVCQQQAILQPAVIGVVVQSDAFQAYYFVDDEPPHWQALAARDSFWQVRTIPTDISLLFTASAPINVPGLAPQIIIQPSGDLVPFSIDIGYRDAPAHYRLIGNQAGEIYLQELK